MRSKDSRPAQPWDEQALAERLGGLADPPAPPGLEEKLLAGIPRRGQTARRRWPTAWWWAAIGTAAAAGLVLALLIGPEPPVGGPTNGTPPLSTAAMERAIDREAAAARLLASATILWRHPAGRLDAAKIRDYVARVYADTSAAQAIPDDDAFEQGELR